MGHSYFRSVVLYSSQFISKYRAMKRRITLFTFVCIFASSCAYTVPVEAPMLIPVIQKAPIRIAVLYDESLRNHLCTASKGYIAEKWPIALGSVSMATFTPIFSAMFTDVVVVPEGAGTRMDETRYIIKLSLEDFTGCDVAWPIFGSSVSITYSADVMLGSAKVLEEWTGNGEGTAQDIIDERIGTGEGEYLGRLTTLAIRRAVGEFLWKFEEDELVLAWKYAAISASQHD